jgi:nucleoside-diphosphate kinase
MITEKTFVIIKPDGIQRSLVGEVIGRFEKVGLKCVAMKMLIPSKDIAEKHYLIDPEWLRKVGEKQLGDYTRRGVTPPSTDAVEIGKKILNNLSTYLTAGPVVVMIWQGVHAVQIVRKLVGSTEPLTSDVGTIRGDFVLDSYELSAADGRCIRNVIHASGNPEEAKSEISLWFQESEIVDYKHIQDAILYDVNLDGILE